MLELNALLKYTKKPLSIIAFPCNQFGAEEPGEDDEILNGYRFVRPGGNFQPLFDVMGKIDVNGEFEHPLYSFLKQSCPPTTMELADKNQLFYNPIRVRDIQWNFEKFLIGKDGKPAYRIDSSLNFYELIDYIIEILD